MAIDTDELVENQQAPTEDAPDSTDDQGDEDAQHDSTGKALVRGSIRLPGVRVTFSETAAIIPENLSWDGWSKSFAGASDIADMSKWWRGDLLRFAMDNEKYSQKYSQFLEGENYGSFKNLMSICGKFAPEKRRSGLTFTHYVAAAPLMPAHEDVCDEILEKAEAEHWSVADVRAAVREYLEGPAQEGDDEPTPISNGRQKPAPAQPAEPVGVQPIILDDIQPGAEYYECPNAACTEYGFLEPVLHCLDCNAHYSPDGGTRCPHCAEVPTADTTPETAQDGETVEPVAVSGTVITPADQQIPADEDDEAEGTGDMRAVLSLPVILDAVPVLTATDPLITARAIMATGDLNRTRLIALHGWLTSVVGALPKGKAFSPAPKPDAPKRGRKSNKEKAAAKAAAAATEG